MRRRLDRCAAGFGPLNIRFWWWKQAEMSKKVASFSSPEGRRAHGAPATANSDHAVHERRTYLRPLVPATLPDGGAGHGRRIPRHLRRVVVPFHVHLRRPGYRHPAGRVARRPLEPARHDGPVLHRHRRLVGPPRPRRGKGGDGRRSGAHRAVFVDLSSRRHRRGSRERALPGQGDRHQRRLREPGRGPCRHRHRGTLRPHKLARRVHRARRRIPRTA